MEPSLSPSLRLLEVLPYATGSAPLQTDEHTRPSRHLSEGGPPLTDGGLDARDVRSPLVTPHADRALTSLCADSSGPSSNWGVGVETGSRQTGDTALSSDLGRNAVTRVWETKMPPKRCPRHMSREKHKLKHNETPSQTYQKSRTQNSGHTEARGDAEPRALSSLVWTNGTATSRVSWAVFTKESDSRHVIQQSHALVFIQRS